MYGFLQNDQNSSWFFWLQVNKFAKGSILMPYVRITTKLSYWNQTFKYWVVNIEYCDYVSVFVSRRKLYIWISRDDWEKTTRVFRRVWLTLKSLWTFFYWFELETRNAVGWNLISILSKGFTRRLGRHKVWILSHFNTVAYNMLLKRTIRKGIIREKQTFVAHIANFLSFQKRKRFISLFSHKLLVFLPIITSVPMCSTLTANSVRE